MRNKKIGWDWGFISGLSDDEQNISLTEKQINFLLSIHPFYQWETRWENLPDSEIDDAMTLGADTVNRLLTPADCGDALGDCYRLDTTSEVFSFYPNDPFTDPHNANGSQTLTLQRWTRWGDLSLFNLPVLGGLLEGIAEFGLGYSDNDVFVTIDEENIIQNPFTSFGNFVNSLTNVWFPYFKVELEGAGQIEIEFCNVPLGCTVVAIPDYDFSVSEFMGYIIDFLDNDNNPPLSWQFIELNRDVTSFPPELVATQVHEVDFEEAGSHTIHCVFIPKLNDEFPFVFPFGGVREVEACGSIQIVGQETGTLINKYNSVDNDRIRTGVIMSTVEDIYAGVLRALETVSQRILLSQDSANVLSDVSINKETGDITLSQSGIFSPSLPDDITAIQKNSGSATYQATQFANLFDSLNAWITGGLPNATIRTLARAYLRPDNPTALDTVVDAYIASNPQHTPDVDALSESIFDAGFYTGVFNNASEQSQDLLTDMLNFLEHSANVVSDWFVSGQNTPNDDYINYDSYIRPSYTVKMNDFSGAYISFQATWGTTSSGRRIRVSAVGTVTDDNGLSANVRNRFDANGVVQGDTFNAFKLGFMSPVALKPGDNVEIDIETGACVWFVEIPPNPGGLEYRANNVFTNPVGEISLTFDDLGAL